MSLTCIFLQINSETTQHNNKSSVDLILYDVNQILFSDSACCFDLLGLVSACIALIHWLPTTNNNVYQQSFKINLRGSDHEVVTVLLLLQ